MYSLCSWIQKDRYVFSTPDGRTRVTVEDSGELVEETSSMSC